MPAFKFRSSAPKPLPEANDIDAELFWALVDIKSNEECWDWQDNLTTGGYGQFRVNYRQLYATRVSYFLAYGIDPLGLVVRHKCDRPICVNPNHLELGTQKDNMQDAVKRGRIASGIRNGTHTKPESKALGERNGLSKLTEQIVVYMRYRYEAGDSCESLARQFDVMGSLVQRIVHGKAWRHVGGPVQSGRLHVSGERASNILTRNQAQSVIDMRVDGHTGEEIAETLGVSQGAIWPILYGRAWKDLDRSKLTKREPKRHLGRDKWPEILAAREAGETLKAIAERYGVWLTAIAYIVKAAKSATIVP